MTIEKRLDKLKERHDVLAKAVERIASEQREMRRDYDERFVANEERLKQIMETMNRLAPIAEIHEQRLDDLEEE
jgi:hypothetical protein